MTTVVERIEGHYEVNEVPYGRDYSWYPECVVVECVCGKRVSLTATETICQCGADHTVLVKEELKSRPPSEEGPCPEDECREWRRHEDEYLRSEYNEQLEWEIMK